MAKKQLFSEIPFLRGQRVTLKRIGREDAPALRRLVDNENIY